LIVHRITKALLEAGVDGHGVLAAQEPQDWPSRQSRSAHSDGERHDGSKAPFEPIDEDELRAIAAESSESERRADDAERELVEWKKIKFMRDRVGEDFSGMILNATKFGLFVELDDLFVEGLVPLQTLGQFDGDRYTYRENTRQIIGDRWGRKFSVGDRVRVVLDRVDAVEKRLQFSILEDEGPARPRKAAPEKKKDKRGEPHGDKPKKKSTRYRIPNLKKLPKKKRKGGRGR
jgi:ribonuclease R